MLTLHDRSQIAKAFATVRQDGAQSIVIRRRIYGEELPPEGLELTLSSIKVRIARLSAGSASSKRGEGSEETRQRCLVVAEATADIQVHDRFNDENGSTYIVNAIRPNRRIQLFADAEMVS